MSVQQEIIIDIHIRTLKLKILELQNQNNDLQQLEVRMLWSRGAKQAKTQYQVLSKNGDPVNFDEKIQINTVIDVDPESGMPSKEKNSFLYVQLNKKMENKKIAEVEFDIADFKYGKYNGMRLFFEKCKENNQYNFEPSESYIEIGIRGTKSEGLIQQRMNEIKQKMALSIKQTLENQPKLQPETPTRVITQFFDKLKSSEKKKKNTETDGLEKEKQLFKSEYENKLEQKQQKISDLQNEFLNQGNELQKQKAQIDKINNDNKNLTEQFSSLLQQLEQNEVLLKNEKSINESLGKSSSMWSDPKKKTQSQISEDLKNVNNEIKEKESKLKEASEILTQNYLSLLPHFNIEKFQFLQLQNQPNVEIVQNIK